MESKLKEKFEALTPSQYEALPEAEKIYWKRRQVKLPLSIYVEYTPVTLSLKDAEEVVRYAVENIVMKEYEPHQMLTEALTKLKEKSK